MDQNTAKAAQQMFNAAQSLVDAKVQAAQANPINEIQPIVIDLSKARAKNQALQLSFPFKGVQVAETTDLDTYVFLVPENNDEGRGAVKLGLLDIFSSEYKFSKCFIYWDAQPAKSMKLNFFTTANISNGRLVIDSKSDVDNVTLGAATLQRNSSLVIVHFGNSTTGGSNNPMTIVSGTDYADGSQGSFVGQNFYIVPPNFTAEVVGCELSITAKPAATDMIIYHTKDGVSGLAGIIGRIAFSPAIPSAAITTPSRFSGIVFPRRELVFTGGAKYEVRKIYDSGEPIFLRNSNTAGSGNIFDAYVAIKLTPKIV